jgi:hypothetical protein
MSVPLVKKSGHNNWYVRRLFSLSLLRLHLSECSPRGLIIHFARRRCSTIGSGFGSCLCTRERPNSAATFQEAQNQHSPFLQLVTMRIEFTAKARGWAPRNVGRERFLGRASLRVLYIDETWREDAINHCVNYSAFTFFWGNVFNLLTAQIIKKRRFWRLCAI